MYATFCAVQRCRRECNPKHHEPSELKSPLGNCVASVKRNVELPDKDSILQRFTEKIRDPERNSEALNNREKEQKNHEDWKDQIKQ